MWVRMTIGISILTLLKYFMIYDDTTGVVLILLYAIIEHFSHVTT